MSEKAVSFKVNEDFYKEIKVHLALKGGTLKDYVINLIKQDLEKSKKK